MRDHPFRLIFTSSRDWRDPFPIFDFLDRLALDAAHGGFPGLIVVHGGCRGGDRIADDWVRNRKRKRWAVSAEVWPAQWKKFGPGAGPIRNEAMVLSGGHGCAAFVGACTKATCTQEPQPHPSHGASGCADLAEKAGIRTERFYADGLQPEHPT